MAHFELPVSYPVGKGPVAIESGDFNNDGKPDLVVLNSISNDASVLLGNGDGTFGAPKPLPSRDSARAHWL